MIPVARVFKCNSNKLLQVNPSPIWGKSYFENEILIKKEENNLNAWNTSVDLNMRREFLV